MNVRAPGTLKTLRLLAAASARRTVNRFVGSFRVFSRRRRKHKPRPVGMLGALFATTLFGAFFVFQGIQISSMCLGALSGRLEIAHFSPEGPFPVTNRVQKEIRVLTDKIDEQRKMLAAARSDSDREEFAAAAGKFEDELRGVLEFQAQRLLFPARFNWMDMSLESKDLKGAEKEATDRLRDRMFAVYEQEGPKAFLVMRAGRPLPFPSTRVWSRDIAGEMTRGAAVMMTFVFAAVLGVSLGLTTRDLAKVEWDMIWLSTFPVRRRSLFLSKALSYGLVNPFGWLAYGTFFFTTLWSAGFGWAALPMAFAGATALNLTTGACIVAAEVLLRRYLSMRAAKTIQAASLLVGFPAMMFVIGAGMSPILMEVLFKITEAVPEAVAWLPWALPAAATRGAVSACVAFTALFCLAACAPLAAAEAAERMTSEGLVRETTVYQGPRSPAHGRRGSSPFRGVVAKDLRFLLRDRALLARVIVLPVLVVVFQVLVNPMLLSSGMGDVSRVSAIIFGVCAFMLLTGGLQALILESRSLWLLYTFPVRLVDLMREKALMWSAISGVYGALLFVLYYFRSGAALGKFLPPAISALAGVVPAAFVLVGLGALGTDPEAQEEQQRMSAWIMYLAFILIGLYIPVILLPMIWLKVLLYGLYWLAPYVIWKTLARRLPLLLDPN